MYGISFRVSFSSLDSQASDLLYVNNRFVKNFKAIFNCAQKYSLSAIFCHFDLLVHYYTLQNRVLVSQNVKK